jgi:hypothetical protein
VPSVPNDDEALTPSSDVVLLSLSRDRTLAGAVVGLEEHASRGVIAGPGLWRLRHNTALSPKGESDADNHCRLGGRPCCWGLDSWSGPDVGASGLPPAPGGNRNILHVAVGLRLAINQDFELRAWVCWERAAPRTIADPRGRCGFRIFGRYTTLRRTRCSPRCLCRSRR